MSELLKRFTSPFEERVKSPIVGPFIVSWSLFNWKIIYATIFLSSKDVFPLHKLDYIVSLLNKYNGLICPLSFTAIYIWLMPFIERFILTYTEEQKHKNLDLKIEISKKHFVDGNKYYDLKRKYDKQREDIIKKEDEILKITSDYNDLKSNNANLNSTIERNKINQDLFNEKYTKLVNRDNPKTLLTGRWQSWVNGNLVDDIEFDGNRYSIVEKNGNRKHAFDLLGIDIDFEIRRVRFVKSKSIDSTINLYNDLEIIDNDTLQGIENQNTQIRYERRKLKS